ncbi:MAG: beta-propeller domain-containing protein [Candidatus Bathyarchaeota archaeon]|nr:beta-propeller domain-containing protein [Candidatus Bathyarchaeota archaeon]
MKVRVYLAMVLLALTTVAAAWAIMAFFQVSDNEKPSLLKTFSSKDELAGFISAKIRSAESDPLIKRLIRTFKATVSAFAEAISSSRTPDYSTTNIQVEGVDEADIVKTDGRIIYAASSKGLISLVKAYPPEEMRVLSKINVNGNIIGLFVGEDKLIVLVEESFMIILLPEEAEKEVVVAPLPNLLPWRTSVKVFNISAPEKPALLGEVIFEGSYVSSRMMGNYIYMVLAYPVLAENLTLLPRWAVNGVWRENLPSDIYYSDSIEAPSSYTLIAAIDASNVSRLTVKSVLTGYASCIYMSRSNLYITFPVLDRSFGGWGKTEVYRIAVDGLRVECEAKGEIRGNVLNQFSMDEYNGYFRAATTLYNPNDGSMESNVYILKMDSLEIVGKIEGLAPGEQIYAARFMGERCYLVTFKKVDPLFTINLSNPSNPRVLGALKIPGYSDYLHPYGEDYLIGIGKEAVPAEEGDFAWYQGLKISLFNISDMERPEEVAKIVIGDRGTHSPVLFDHHALLFDKRRSLLVIPITEAKIFEEDYPGERPPWAYGRPVFQGAYVFHVSPEEGIILRGRVSHIMDGEIDPIYEVKRALYINETLYTVSDGKIKANSLADLSEISEVSLE